MDDGRRNGHGDRMHHRADRLSSDSAPSLAQAFPILAKPALSTPETLQRFLNRGDTQLRDALRARGRSPHPGAPAMCCLTNTPT